MKVKLQINSNELPSNVAIREFITGGYPKGSLMRLHLTTHSACSEPMLCVHFFIFSGADVRKPTDIEEFLFNF